MGLKTTFGQMTTVEDKTNNNEFFQAADEDDFGSIFDRFFLPLLPNKMVVASPFHAKIFVESL